ncbi:MAG: respiratory nitrate reductase subunit gamma [Nitrospirota bacterium]
MEFPILTIVFSLIAYGAAAIFAVGFAAKVIKYARTPSPLKIPTTPAPTTSFGVVLRVLGDVLLFKSLYKGNKWTWVGGIIFHYTFLLVVLRHLRYFLYPVPGFIMALQDYGIYAAYILPLAVLYLLMRRTTVDRTVFISSLADYFALALIFGIAVTGLLMKYYVRPFMVDVKGFIYGLVTLNPSSVPLEPVFLLHLLLVCTLLAYFPFSKLMHAGGIFFSPTRTQTDTPRERRHVNPWSPNLSA